MMRRKAAESAPESEYPAELHDGHGKAVPWLPDQPRNPQAISAIQQAKTLLHLARVEYASRTGIHPPWGPERPSRSIRDASPALRKAVAAYVEEVMKG